MSPVNWRDADLLKDTMPIEPIQHFIYPMTSTSGYTFGGEEISPENYWKIVEADKTSDWPISTGFLMIEPHDWVWAYFGGSEKRICGVGTVQPSIPRDADEERHMLRIRWNQKLTKKLRAYPIYYHQYQQKVQAATQRAKPRTVQILRQWLNEKAPGSEENDAKVKIAQREVRVRLGQAAFRLDTLRLYRGRCAVTGCTEPNALQAAHILPVKKGGRHASGNSILLRADIHNLFDLGLITIDRSSKVMVSPDVTDPAYGRLRNKTLTLPSGTKVRRSLAKKFAEHQKFHT